MGLVTLEEAKVYLGVGEHEEGDTEEDALITRFIVSAEERLKRATGIRWTQELNEYETAAEAVRVMVWLSYWSLRGDVEGVDFIREHLNGLITQLQYSAEAEARTDMGDV